MVYITLKPFSDKLQSVLKWVAVVVAIYFVWAINHQKEKTIGALFCRIRGRSWPTAGCCCCYCWPFSIQGLTARRANVLRVIRSSTFLTNAIVTCKIKLFHRIIAAHEYMNILQYVQYR